MTSFRTAFPVLILSLLLAACSGGDSTPSEQTSPAPAGTTASAVDTAQPPSKPSAETDSAVTEPQPAQAASATTPTEEPATTTTAQTPADSDTAPATSSSAADNRAANAGTEPTPPAANATTPVNDGPWVAGEHYFVLEPQQPRLQQDDKVEVVEVFSYGCPACNSAQPYMKQLTASLPSYARMEYLPVSFRPDENFPLYQRAFYTAQALGVAREAHNAMFTAIWVNGDIGTFDRSTGRPKPKDEWPTIEDIAEFYAGYGVDPATFVATSKAFAVNMKMKRADQMLKNWQVRSTPSIVIDGKYRYTANSAGGYQQMLDLTRWLVQKEYQSRQDAP